MDSSTSSILSKLRIWNGSLFQIRIQRISGYWKFLVNADGSLGARNAVSVGKIEEKMGIHGNATCVMNYDGATGWLLGDLQ